MFVDPGGEAVKQYEREEGYRSGQVAALTELNIQMIQRVRDQLPPGDRDQVEIGTSEETARFNVVLIDHQTCVMQPYVPRTCGVDSPTFMIACKSSTYGLFPSFEQLLPHYGNERSDDERHRRARRSSDRSHGQRPRNHGQPTTRRTTRKSDRDFATDIDYEIEQRVRDHLLRATPDIGFLGEEQGSSGLTEGQAFWAFDPVDGTSNFAHGLPLCGSSLGLIVDGRPVLGIVDLPLLAERFTATHDGGAFLNGERIHASSTRNLGDAIIGTGDYAVGPDAAAKT